MTSSIATFPDARRTVPSRPSPEQRKRLRRLIEGSHWVRRGDWGPWLQGDRPAHPWPIDELTPDQCVATASWLRQQRHALYRALEGGLQAPEGWLESTPLYRSLMGHCHHAHPRF